MVSARQTPAMASVGAEERARERWFGTGLFASLFANVTFGIQRGLTEALTGASTGWWINAVGAAGLGALTWYYWRDRAARRRRALHLGLILCAACLVTPVAWGMVSSPWWLTILPLAAALLVGARDGMVWAAVSAILIAGSSLWPADLVVAGAAGETALEATASRVFLVLILFGIARSARIVSDAQADELRKSAALLTEASETKSRFLANVSHEMRTPLSGVIGMTELALDESLPREARGHVQTAHECATGLLAIINDILDISKAEAGAITLSREPFALADTVGAALRTVGVRAESKGLTLTASVDPAVARDRIGDALRLRQVLTNLLGNAVKFTSHGGVRVEIGAGEDLDEVVITVSDTGIGMTPAELDRLFVPFSQVDDSVTRRFGGTGLGLAISRDLVRLMGGDIAVDSVKGAGTTFRVTLELPAVTAPEPEDAPVSALVLSPDPTLRLSLGRAFERLHGEATRAASVEEAIEALESGRVEVVVADVNLGDAEAASLVAAIGRLGLEASATWVSATGFVGRSKRRVAMGLGGMLDAPLFPDQLSRWVHRVRLRPRLGAPVTRNAGLAATAAAHATRVLVVDDTEVTLMLVRQVLARNGYDVVTADDGCAALEMLRTAGPFDLLITDVQMPGFDGLELTRRAREQGFVGPIVALTAHALTGDGERFLAAGVDAYLTKPFDRQVMLQTLGRLCATAPAPAPSERPASARATAHDV